MAQRYRHLSLAVPMLAEAERLPALLEALRRQTVRDFTLYCCVNNPEAWHTSGDAEQQRLCADNREALAMLHSVKELEVVILDRCSPGRGWTGKRQGVGWARKVLLEAIDAACGDDELVVSLDADTLFAENYLECLLEAMNGAPDCWALAVPYRHPLCGDEPTDRAMLRYELYMRHYMVSLHAAAHRYAFAALGSAMAFPLWAYRRVGGITPLQGGEDFYLMQKFAKCGPLLQCCRAEVYPSGRPSLRVPFGTGPAVAKGVEAMEQSYPLYPQEAFEAVATTFAAFPRLYDEELETPMSAFLRRQLKTDDLWQPLRKNFKTRALFVHACEERVDGLRILQFLRAYRQRLQAEGGCRSAEEELSLFCSRQGIELREGFSFCRSSIAEIDALRDAVRGVELRLRAEA